MEIKAALLIYDKNTVSKIIGAIFFAQKTFALLMSAQNTNNKERLFKDDAIFLAMIKSVVQYVSTWLFLSLEEQRPFYRFYEVNRNVVTSHVHMGKVDLARDMSLDLLFL
jgi:hypothetical protein